MAMDPARVSEESIRRVVGFYVERATEAALETVASFLEGGMVPGEVVGAVAPVLQELLGRSGDRSFERRRSEVADFERVHERVEELYAQRHAAREVLIATIAGPWWSDAERRIANGVGLEVLSIVGVDAIADGLAHSVILSGFAVSEVVGAMRDDQSRFIRFAAGYLAACNKTKPVQEWNPLEGDQQRGGKPGRTLGMAKGFLIDHCIFYLYARDFPDGLDGYMKLKKMPQAKKVARAVLRAYSESA
jgi:hypothetical protein